MYDCPPYVNQHVQAEFGLRSLVAPSPQPPPQSDLVSASTAGTQQAAVGLGVVSVREHLALYSYAF